MRILVCGSRHFNDGVLMREVLKEHFKGAGDTLIHGCAKGADRLSEESIYILFPDLGSIPSIERYPADWDKHGKAAGPIRNTQMLKEGRPDLVIAFLGPNSRGTKNMIEQSTKANIPVIVKEIK